MEAREWNWDFFEENNKKLDVCLKYGKNDIILISVNAKNAAEKIAQYLKDAYHFSLVSCGSCTQSIVNLLKQYGNHASRLCLYHINDSADYDIIKTLNISRELLRDVGRVVLLMPQGLVDRVFFDNPNLYDYISIILDYNIPYPCPVKPIYSEENRHFISKKLLTAQRRIFREGEKIKTEGIAEYYHYLNNMIYQSLDDEDYTEINKVLDYILEKSAKEIGVNNKNHQKNINLELMEMSLDIYSETALFFLRKNQFGHAYNLYLKCLAVLYSMNELSGMRLAEVYQGLAYCQYENGNLQLCTDLLQEMLKLMRPLKNEAWECKILNDLGTCIFEADNATLALEQWNEVRQRLNKGAPRTLTRDFRNIFNRTLAESVLRQNPKRYINDWTYLGEQLQIQTIGFSLENFQYLFLDSWLHFYRGENEAAKRIADTAYRIGLEILPENNAITDELRQFRQVIELQM